MEAVHSVPGSFATNVVNVAARWNVPRGALLAEIGVTPESLEDPSTRIPWDDFVALIDRARRVTSEPGFGLYLGLHARISAHGYLGFAAMTARVLREALELVVRFGPTQTTAIGLRLGRHGSSAVLTIEEHASLGAARESILYATSVGLWRMGNAITGRDLTGEADFAFPEPPFAARLAPMIGPPGRVRYDQDESRLVFPSEQLEWPLALSDPAAMRLALEQCERDLTLLSGESTLASRVSARIVDGSGEVRPLETIARELAMSSRTLKRRLAEEGASYTELLEERRKLRSFELLRSDLSIDGIAERLGYSDAANFTRAFRRWTNKTPSQFRSSSTPATASRRNPR
jgi:AraC-like DNA-binding protein